MLAEFVVPHLGEEATGVFDRGVERSGEVDEDAVGVGAVGFGFAHLLSRVTNAVEATVLGGIVAPAIETDEVELAVDRVKGSTHGTGEKFTFERDGGSLGAGGGVITQDEVVKTGAVGESEVATFEGAPLIRGDFNHAADGVFDAAGNEAEWGGDVASAPFGWTSVEFSLMDFDDGGGGGPVAFLGGDPVVVTGAADAHAVANSVGDFACFLIG